MDPLDLDPELTIVTSKVLPFHFFNIRLILGFDALGFKAGGFGFSVSQAITHASIPVVHAQVLVDEAKHAATEDPNGLSRVLEARYTFPEPRGIPPGATQQREEEEGGSLEAIEEVAGEEQTWGTIKTPGRGAGKSAKGTPRAKKR
jgi:hypothetical protein